MPLPYMSYCAKFGHSVLNDMGEERLSNIWERWVKRYEHEGRQRPAFQGHSGSSKVTGILQVSLTITDP